MTKEEQIEMGQLMIDCANDPSIKVQEQYLSPGSPWCDCDPDWDFSCWRFRRKPEPLVLYANAYPENDCFAYATQEQARQAVGPNAIRVAVKMVEAEGQG